jgi:predicted alpha/beta-fold hydrolase
MAIALTPLQSTYVAPWWLPGGHLQTIWASLRPPPPARFERARWDTPDGDFVDVDFCGPPGGKPVVLFHGLEGSSGSHYARSIAAHAVEYGWRLAIPHFRGCSGEPNRTPRAYHSGDSEEIGFLLNRVSSPGEKLFAIGISLGGNAMLKWLGEQGEAGSQVVARAVAVSAPIDLPAAGRALDRGLNRALYTRMFLSTLKPKSLAKLERFPGIFDAERVRNARTFRVFDDAVTAPLHGFAGVDDYWTRSASGPYLERIRVPTLVLNARNDPFLPEADLLAATSRAAPCVLLEFPRTGGHVGFHHPWLARRISEFFQA